MPRDPLEPAVLRIAVSKGRIYEESLPLLRRAGIAPRDDFLGSRKLILPCEDARIELLVIRAQDVPTFVEYGAADLGIAGKDVLLEYSGDGLYEPVDLGIARCRMVVAGIGRQSLRSVRPRVATKYVHTARRHFARQGVQAEIIPLYGSMEIAPLTGLAECIVDLVDTGATLAANGLTELETIAEISARLVVNRASMKMKHEPVAGLIASIGEAVEGVRDRSRFAERVR
jgi:ATP phosphoribosyltransferase